MGLVTLAAQRRHASMSMRNRGQMLVVCCVAAQRRRGMRVYIDSCPSSAHHPAVSSGNFLFATVALTTVASIVIAAARPATTCVRTVRSPKL